MVHIIPIFAVSFTGILKAPSCSNAASHVFLCGARLGLIGLTGGFTTWKDQAELDFGCYYADMGKPGH